MRVRFYVDVDNLYCYWNVRHKADTKNVINFLITLFQQLKEIGTIKRFYSVYDVYYGLLHFIQPSVIAVLYLKNGVRSVNLPIPAKTLKLMSYGSRGVDSSDTTIGLSNFSANQR